MVRLLKMANRKEPLTRANALERLKKKFPDYADKDLELFVTTNLPTRLRVVRGLDVRNNGLGPRGYWIVPTKYDPPIIEEDE